MAYTVDYSDGTKTAITVNDGTIDTTTSLSLVGKNYYGYGEVIAENFLHLLEHFASATAPSNPKEGQIWFDNTAADKEMKYYDGANWVSMGGGSELHTIQDNLGNDKQVIIMKASSTIIAVISSHEPFTVSTTHTPSSAVQAIFTTVSKGYNLNPTTGSGTDFFYHGTATKALYADLAELYSSDQEYDPGTVLMIGGEAEVTQTTEAFSPEVFGIVSSNPAYLMNSAMEGTTVPVALEGRVPCKVIGPVRKGQRLVSSEEPGTARAVSDYERQEALDWYRIVGRAIADKDSEGVELIEVVVGIK
tara:strand:+ start:4920 stop:5831 length:912 start_codon:yes stop_codon:yes gene_type:complete